MFYFKPIDLDFILPAAAINVIHSNNIVHRDLKPQNILLNFTADKNIATNKDIQLKIADFGFARFLQEGVMAATLCGSVRKSRLFKLSLDKHRFGKLLI